MNLMVDPARLSRACELLGDDNASATVDTALARLVAEEELRRLVDSYGVDDDEALAIARWQREQPVPMDDWDGPSFEEWAASDDAANSPQR